MRNEQVAKMQQQQRGVMSEKYDKYDKYEKYARLRNLLKEREIPHWKCAALAVMRERTFRYKMSRTGGRFNDKEMFAIQRNVFPDKTLEEIFGE